MELLNDINIIHEKLAILSTEIRLRGKFNMLDINVLAETFFAELMNLIFGYQLKNINLYEQNAKAIDLIDTENKIIVQVSSDNSKGKVQSSLSGIKEEYKQNNYHFIFISISEEVTKLKEKSFEIPEGITFDPKNDCYDNKTLIKDIESKGSECIKRVSDYLNKTVGYSYRNSAAPDFKFYPVQNLIARDTAVDNLHNLVNKKQFTNLCGLGGSGKTSLINLFVAKYASEYNQIAYIVVNNNIKDDFLSQINETIHLFKPEDNATERINKIEELATKEQIQYKEKNKDKYKSIIDYLEFNYQSNNPNLLIIDINNAPKDEIEKFGNDLLTFSRPFNKIYPYGWKYLIVSREKIYSGIEELNLNSKETENFVFLKQLFIDNAGQENYKSFSDDDYAELFKKIFYSPLITEQLGRFLRNKESYSLPEIFALLDKDRFKNKERVGLTSHNRHSEEEKTIIGFLRNIVDLDNFSKDEQKLLRHFILWPSDYIPRNVIEGLLEGIFNTEDDFDEALDNLIERKIIACQKNNNEKEYKLHDMVATSLRLQIKVFGAMYQKYVNNIDNILNNANSDFIQFWKCIGYSLNEYDLRVWIGYRYGVGTYTLENDDYIKLLNSIYRFVRYIPFSYVKEMMEQMKKIFIGINEEIKEYLKETDPEKNKALDLFDNLIKGCSLDDLASALPAQKQVQLILKELAKTEDAKLGCDAQISIFEAYEYEDLKRFTEAEKKYKKAIKIREKQLENITKTDSGNKSNCFEYQKDIADWYNKLAKLEAYNLKKQKYYKKAIQNIEKIINNKENAFDYNLNVTFTFAITYFNYANLLVSQFGDETSVKENSLNTYKSAEENYIKAIDILEKYTQTTDDAQFFLAQTYKSLANLQQNKDYISAEENYMKAIKILEQLSKDNEYYKIELAQEYDSLAKMQEYQLSDYSSAKDNYLNAIKTLENMPKDKLEYQNILVQEYHSLANMQLNNPLDYASVQNSYENAIKILKNFPKENLDYQNKLAQEYDTLASFQQIFLNDYSSAEENYDNAIRILENLPKDNPEYQHNLASSYKNLASWYDEQHSYADAIRSITNAIEIAADLKEKYSKYHIYWLEYKYTLAKIEFNNGKSIEEVKNTLLAIKSLAQQCLNDNPNDGWTKIVNHKIDIYIDFLLTKLNQ